MKALILIVLALNISNLAKAHNCDSYPAHWWQKNFADKPAWWEITPDSVKCSEKKVILSKRNELGILSNFAPTAFILDGKRYASLEGFWQMLKFAENEKDPRFSHSKEAPYTREEVGQLTAFTAKEAGDWGSKLMKELNINWVTYKGQKMTYRTEKPGPHFKLIKRAMRAKLEQNQEVETVLKATGELELLPDHEQKNNYPAWKYHKIWMELRKTL